MKQLPPQKHYNMYVGFIVTPAIDSMTRISTLSSVIGMTFPVVKQEIILMKIIVLM
jgi:hypothetical protein